MVAICKQVFVIGLEEHDRRRKEVEEFYFCVDDAKKENKATAIRTIDEFKKYKKKVCITIENDGIVSKCACRLACTAWDKHWRDHYLSVMTKV